VSLALWGSPDRALRLCQTCFEQWDLAYQRLVEQIERPAPGLIIRLVDWNTWLEGFSREAHEGERG
jgi:hypothetical protein